MATSASILLVEDDSDMRSLLQSYLARQGYRVIEASDSDAALRVLLGDDEIDLLLTDVVMPGTRDGFALGREARRLRPGLKVLHVTGYAERIKANPRMARTGAIMQKPVARRDLLDRVSHLLGNWAVDQNDVLQRAYRYWADKAEGRRMPDRKDLDPVEIKDLLPYLSIIELVGDERRCRYRLTGTRIVDALGCDPTGRFVDEVFDGADREFMGHLISEVTAKAQPLYVASAFRSADNGLSTERLLLPFTLGGGDPRQIVTVQTFDWTRRPGTLHEISRQHIQRTHSFQWQPADSANIPS
jgi:CheY-like chemotaxis protein